MTTLISIISRQTLPNVLFIKQMGPFDAHIFITSAQMEREGRSDDIIASLRLYNVTRVEIEPEDLHQCLSQLHSEDFDPEKHYVLHVTGGTKMTSFACLTHFTSAPFNNTEVYYMPMRKSVIQRILPEKKDFPLKAKVNLYEYLAAYGVYIEQEQKVEDHSNRIHQAVQLWDQVKQGSVPREILAALNNRCHWNDRRFLMGEWFELWVASYIQRHFKLDRLELSYNMRLTRSELDNNENTEYDVVYVKDNKLYIVECKFFIKGNFNKSKIKSDWYKLAGLKLFFGLSVNPYFITANKIPNKLMSGLKQNMPLFNIRGIADIDVLKREEAFHNFLNKL